MSAKEHAIIGHLKSKGYTVEMQPLITFARRTIEVSHPGCDVIILDNIDLISLAENACASCIADDIARRVASAIGTPPEAPHARG